MERKAVILAAGMGTRLKPLTLTTHKCMTRVNGVPILTRALECLRAADCREAALVVGYLADQIREEVGTSRAGLRLRYVENPVYAETNTSYSLQLGLEAAGDFDSLLVLEGDVFFEEALLRRLVRDPHDNATLLETYHPPLDGTFAERDEESGYVRDWTHKSAREAGYTLEDKYKTINIHKFGRRFTEETLLPEARRVCEESAGREPLETVMRRIVRRDGRAVYGLASGGLKWAEIDDTRDLALAEALFATDDLGGRSGQ